MKTLRQAEPISLGLPLRGSSLYSAMYVNELDWTCLAEVAMPGLFHDYLFALTELAQNDNQNPLCAALNWRCFVGDGLRRRFLHCAGSGEPVDPDMTYRYREQKGLLLQFAWII